MERGGGVKEIVAKVFYQLGQQEKDFKEKGGGVE